jgi:hypothetical protein
MKDNGWNKTLCALKELAPTHTTTEKYFLFALSILSVLYIFPLTLSGVLYDADTSRTLTGTLAYHRDARHLADFIFNLITPGSNAIDLFPYTTILSSLIVSYSGFLILRSFFNLDDNFSKLVASLSLLINPFFLGNLAFHFDSLTMSLSIFFVVYSLVVDKDSKNSLNCFLSSILLFMSLCLYQSSLNIYFIFGIYIYSRNWAQGSFQFSDIIKFVSKTALALIAYYYFAKANITGGYQAYRSSTLSLDGDFLTNLFTNYIDGMYRVKLAFQSKAGYILILIYTACIVLFFYKQYKNKINFSLKKVLITFSATLLCVFFIFGFHTFFENPPHYARNYMAFGAFNMLAIIYLIQFKYFQKIKILFLGFYLLYSFGISAIFSNISRSQDKHIQFLNTQIVMDLNELAKDKEVISIAFSRSFPASQEYRNAVEGLPILMMLIQRRLTPTWPNYQDFKKIAPYTEQYDATEYVKSIEKNKLKPEIIKRSYSIYVDGDKYFVQTF